MFFNEFWLLRDKLITLNETVKEVAVNMELGPISLTRWQMYMQIDQSFQLHMSFGNMMDGESDELKVIFVHLRLWEHLPQLYHQPLHSVL